MNGSFGSFLSKKTAALISNADSVKEMGPYPNSAEKLGLQVVPVDFLDAVKLADPFTLIKDMNLSPWNCIDVSSLIFQEKQIIKTEKNVYFFHLAK